MRIDPKDTSTYESQRHRMVDEQLRKRGISNKRLLEVMDKVPRHLFVPLNYRRQAYKDYPLPIGSNQTISQPYIVAEMIQALCPLSGTKKILEIGTGSGYQTALLAELSDNVVSIESSLDLFVSAEHRLRDLGYSNITLVIGDGTTGVPSGAPYDKIIASGSLPDIPQQLITQLKPNGIAVFPVGTRQYQQLVTVNKQDGKITKNNLSPCRFVPLIGKAGWSN